MEILGTPERPFCVNQLTQSGHYAVFLMAMGSDAMDKAGILEDDILVINRQTEPEEGDIVVAEYSHPLGEDLCCGYLRYDPVRFEPDSHNPIHTTYYPTNYDYPPEISYGIFGVVTHAISRLRGSIRTTRNPRPNTPPV